MAPHRVPIIKPSRAVNPMVVSMLVPSRMAQRLAPLPRCATTVRFAASSGEMARSLPAMASYDRPWNPYFRTPSAS